MKYRPKLDPKVDLVGATPEKLARALFRRTVPLRPELAGRKKKTAGAETPAKDDSLASVTSRGASAGARPDDAVC